MADNEPFQLSEHARRRIKQRRISATELRRAIANPDQSFADEDDVELSHAIKQFRRAGTSRIVHVVYNHVVSPVRVVTAWLDRKMRKL